MRPTWKFRFVGAEAKRLSAAGVPATEIARRIGVDAQTVRRWRREGRLLSVVRRRPASLGEPRPLQTPKEWAAGIRARYELDATSDALLSLAAMCAGMARDPNLTTRMQLRAGTRFSSLVRDLRKGLIERCAD